MTTTTVSNASQSFAQKGYRRRVVIGNNINEESAKKAIADLRRLDSESDEVIVLAIDSNGGIYSQAKLIMEAIKEIHAPVYGLALNLCLSSAFSIMQTCKRRLAFRTATFGIHNAYRKVVIEINPDSEPSDFAPLVEQVAAEQKKLREEVITLIQTRSALLSRDQILEIMREAQPMPASVALHRQFIDEILV